MAAVWASCLTGEDPPATGFVQFELQFAALDCDDESPGIPSGNHVGPRDCEALRSIQAVELRLNGIEATVKRKHGGIEQLTLDSGEQVLRLVRENDRLPGFIGIYEVPVGELRELMFDVEDGTAPSPLARRRSSFRPASYASRRALLRAFPSSRSQRRWSLST